MPHVLNIMKTKPLRLTVSEYTAMPRALASLQLTRMKDSPLHCQPVCVRFVDDSVGVCFFEQDGTYTHMKEMIPRGENRRESLVPDEFERVPMPHIHRDETLVERMEELKMEHKTIAHFNDHRQLKTEK